MEPFDAVRVPLDGRVLVEASAGTGKTHAITTLVLRLILEGGLEVDRILVVTFTEAATAELRVRLRARLAAALSAFQQGGVSPRRDPDIAALYARATDRDLAVSRLRYALENVDQAGVHTIHAFCQRMLRQCAFESGTELDAELTTDVSPLADEVLCDYWTRELAASSRTTVLSLREAKLWPSACRQLVAYVSRDPYMLVLPERADSEEASTAPFHDAYRRVKERWERSRIERELTDSPALNRGKYKKTQIAGLCDAMDAYLSGAEPPLPRLWERFELFRASVLASACNRGFEGRAPSGPFYTACDWLARTVDEYSRAATTQSLSFRRGLVDWVRAELPRRKSAAGIMAFDDLLLRLHDALHGPGGDDLAAAVRRRFSVALVDEFQDTDPIQYGIFDRIWRDGALYLIGDPKQAIYSFRGADVFAYLRAARRVAPERRFAIAVNWRSDPRLLTAVKEMLCAPRAPFLIEAIELPEVRPDEASIDRMPAPALRILFARRDGSPKPKPISKTRAREQLPHAIATDIAELLGSGTRIDDRAVQPGDIAVLTRTNDQAFRVQAALVRAGVRAVVLGDQSVFEDEQPEARELEQLLGAVVEPTRSPAVRAALSSDLLGLTALDLIALDADGGWDRWIERFRDWHARWTGRGFVQMFRAFLADAHVFERLLAKPGGERRITNLLHLMELLHGAQTSLHLGPAGVVGWLREQRASARARPESAQIRLESDDRAVKVTTVHKSKGLEYPIVYCPYLWDGRLLSHADDAELVYRDPDADEAVKLTLAPTRQELERAKAERLAESIRLLYVALTRARHRCTLVWGGFKDFETSALGYVLHPPVLAMREPSVEDVRAHLVNLNDERMLRDLAGLAAEHPRAIEVSDLVLDAAAERAPLERAAPERRLEARSMHRPVHNWWRTASFTALTTRAVADGGEGRDRDEHAREPTTVMPSGAAITLSSFPRGARAGNFFHELLEEMNFAEPLSDREATVRRVVDKLALYRYPQELADQVVEALCDVVATPLATGQKRIRLADVTASERRSELEFHLPVAGASVRRVLPRGTQLELSFSARVAAPGRLSAARLASVLAEHPSPEVPAHYAAELGRLAFLPLEGFVKGYIDLVFTRHGRFYLVDYKTSHLGDTLGAYASARLPEAMAHSHYYLQYHLYAIALHRHLERRIRGYRYEDHFGGVYYLFIKGMTPALGAQNGVFFERPPPARIEALSELLDHPGYPGGRGA